MKKMYGVCGEKEKFVDKLTTVIWGVAFVLGAVSVVIGAYDIVSMLTLTGGI